jgi:AP-2 complex subunit alpha
VNGRETLTLLDGCTTRYLGLEAMGKLALSMSEETGGIIKRHLETVLSSLKDPDISIRCVQRAALPHHARYLSIAALLLTLTFTLSSPHSVLCRRRALDLCFGMCDQSNSQRIVGELLNYLLHADFDIQEELALKIAVLAEKFAASNRTWYVDTVLRLISLGGSNVPDDVWYVLLLLLLPLPGVDGPHMFIPFLTVAPPPRYRVVQIVTNHEDIQEYAVMNAFKVGRTPLACARTFVPHRSIPPGHRPSSTPHAANPPSRWRGISWASLAISSMTSLLPRAPPPPLFFAPFPLGATESD